MVSADQPDTLRPGFSEVVPAFPSLPTLITTVLVPGPCGDTAGATAREDGFSPFPKEAGTLVPPT